MNGFRFRMAAALAAMAMLGASAGAFAHGGDSHSHAPPRGNPGPGNGSGDVARGTVYFDRNANNRRDPGEHGIRGVSVSNGLDVVQTDGQGEYEIALPPESILFISKPAEWEVPVDANNLPQFYYTHYPQGTPPIAAWRWPVIEPTGPLPQRIDFALLRGRSDVKNFRVMGFADTQAGTDEEEDGIREDIVGPLVGNPYGAVFGVVAGDVVNDNLALFPRHNQIMSKIGIPIWNVPGNHDTNDESPSDRYATQTYSRYYGPTDFSFNHGEVHFIGMDNVDNGDVDRPSEGAVLTQRQLQWLRNDLRHVPRDKLIVLVTHISLITYALDSNNERYALGGNINTINLREVVEVFKDFRRVYAIAGHDTSNSWKVQLDHTHNWHGDWFLSHTLAEVRGNGWSTGPRTERDVRTATMQDGNPNGYYVMTFKGTDVFPRFIPGKGDPNRSIRISLDPLPLGTRSDSGQVLAINRGPLAPDTKVVVNLFDGGDQDVVELSFNGGPWQALPNVLRTDPFMERRFLQHQGTPDRAERPVPSSHIWEYALPANLRPGAHAVAVRARDNFGQTSRDTFSFEVLPASATRMQTLMSERAMEPVMPADAPPEKPD